MWWIGISWNFCRTTDPNFFFTIGGTCLWCTKLFFQQLNTRGKHLLVKNFVTFSEKIKKMHHATIVVLGILLRFHHFAAIVASGIDNFTTIVVCGEVRVNKNNDFVIQVDEITL